jgi:hypothetical protein
LGRRGGAHQVVDAGRDNGVHTFKSRCGGYREAMADESGTGQEQPEAARPYTGLIEQGAELFDELAQRAEELARTAELGAEVHAQLPSHLVNPPDHAERERILAAAERAAAEAYRAHQVPPTDVRAAIIRAGHINATGPAGRPSGSRPEEHPSPDD